MAEYIEREAMVKASCERCIGGYVSCNKERCILMEVIHSIPAADVRPVVTCGECEFWNRERISCEGLARCNTGESGIRYRNRHDFCSRGKKREEN